MLVTEEVKCPYCGMKVPAFSGGLINKPAVKAYCPQCKKEFPIDNGLKGTIKKLFGKSKE